MTKIVKEAVAKYDTAAIVSNSATGMKEHIATNVIVSGALSVEKRLLAMIVHETQSLKISVLGAFSTILNIGALI